MLARRIHGLDGREAERAFAASSMPALIDLDGHVRLMRALALRAPRLRKPKAEPEEPVILVPSARVVKRASSDAALLELQYVERMMPTDALSLCPSTNKVRHRSKLWALLHRNRLANEPNERFPERLEAYKCKGCGDWHVGHKA